MKAILSLFLSLVLLSACSSWQTSYDAPVPVETSQNWRLGDVVVTVPETLTVSEDNVYLPDADIVWREDPLGDSSRYAQVAEIIETAVTRGASGLSGSTPVRIKVTVGTFHALTEIARYGLSSSGVHNITYAMQVFDMRSGAALTDAETIQADLVALVGDQALEAEAQGITQKVRITDHIAKVTAGYLGIGPDMRSEFARVGR
ncbi:DUF6778 family protein [Dinoroseobacter sp. S76]|uniref:DUF6778 family protein n=1 Tax=Dinoroseobacter sp. S76 TaxID=3415124 RepID=UPI003C799148